MFFRSASRLPSLRKFSASNDFRAPRGGETLSSYLAAWRGYFHVRRQALDEAIARVDPTVVIALSRDPDYPNHPGWSQTLAGVTNLSASVLEELAQLWGPWPLLPEARTNACLGCLELAGYVTNQVAQKFWTYSTMTQCLCCGLPFVEVPAVGWGWADIPREVRRQRYMLMEHPGVARVGLEQEWAKVGEGLKTASYFAELSCWATCAPNRKYMDYLGCQPHETALVWENMLTLLCASWQPFAAPSVAMHGIPCSLWSEHSTAKFGGANMGILQGKPTMELFRSIANPAERRSCILIALDAIRHDYLQKIYPRPEYPRFGSQLGWLPVVASMPELAWDWLIERAQYWPPPWAVTISGWEQVRCKTKSARERGARKRWLR